MIDTLRNRMNFCLLAVAGFTLGIVIDTRHAFTGITHGRLGTCFLCDPHPILANLRCRIVATFGTVVHRRVACITPHRCDTRPAAINRRRTHLPVRFTIGRIAPLTIGTARDDLIAFAFLLPLHACGFDNTSRLAIDDAARLAFPARLLNRSAVFVARREDVVHTSRFTRFRPGTTCRLAIVTRDTDFTFIGARHGFTIRPVRATRGDLVTVTSGVPLSTRRPAIIVALAGGGIARLVRTTGFGKLPLPPLTHLEIVRRTLIGIFDTA